MKGLKKGWKTERSEKEWSEEGKVKNIWETKKSKGRRKVEVCDTYTYIIINNVETDIEFVTHYATKQMKMVWKNRWGEKCPCMSFCFL